MKILALDTATEACSAALFIDGDITSHYQLAPREHSRLILKMIDELLHQAKLPVSQLDAIAFGRGPGSFMGLRIAAGVVQGIAFAHDLPVIAVSCLLSIAQRAYEQTGCGQVMTAIDARMAEVYWACYRQQAGQWQIESEECVISPDNIQLPATVLPAGEAWVGAGTGWGSYKDRLLAAQCPLVIAPYGCQLPTILPDCLPSAETIVKLAVDELKAGNTVSAADAIPVYLRNDVAKKPRPVVL
ncbi:MAG: tRNA (adenosine(37)-N6)-threonylcarbamoyltransferase complex dimerization subunit type 1 TsaB [Gammaproteobacteria bacterium]|nr:tRNA (adenosine(37)-N6)-threonylcarbamoyltransferase complex dimerization subunit type 1 TsaB [Gammaproteobacteria bacterium]